MTREPSPFPHDADYAQARSLHGALLDATNASLREHLAECPVCREEPFGHCPVALRIISNPPKIEPKNN